MCYFQLCKLHEEYLIFRVGDGQLIKLPLESSLLISHGMD